MLIAEKLGLGSDAVRTIVRAATLHDIGKIAIPDAILNKPGPLTEEELAIVREHPVRGYLIIQKVRSLQRETVGVCHHHERLNGSGYPDGLRGEAIPLEARIIAVADVYDALTSSRVYRSAWDNEKALSYLHEEAGVTFDPNCVAALSEVVAQRLAGLLRQKGDGAVAPLDEVLADC